MGPPMVAARTPAHVDGFLRYRVRTKWQIFLVVVSAKIMDVSGSVITPDNVTRSGFLVVVVVMIMLTRKTTATAIEIQLDENK